MTSKSINPSHTHVVIRVFAATIGGYALCWSMFSVLCAWLPFTKATVWYLTGQLAPLPLLGVLLWAFATAHIQRALLWPLALAACLQFLAVLR